MVKKKTFNVSFSLENYQQLRKKADNELRSVSNMLEHIFLKFIEEEATKKTTK